MPFISEKRTCSKTAKVPSVVSAPGAPLFTGIPTYCATPLFHKVRFCGTTLFTST